MLLFIKHGNTVLDPKISKKFLSLYAIYYYTICMIGHKAILFVPIKPCRRSTDEEDFDD
jgi:hypothetical protein